VSYGIVSEDSCREKDLPVNIYLTSFRQHAVRIYSGK